MAKRLREGAETTSARSPAQDELFPRVLFPSEGHHFHFQAVEMSTNRRLDFFHEPSRIR